MNILKINGQALTGIYVDAAVSFNKPAKNVSNVRIPGRNGRLIIDEGTFDNVLISYPVYEKSTFPDEFDAIVNWLASLQGYQRIECSNDPQHYRLGRFVVPEAPTAKRLNKDGYYTLTFDCKPQRWLLSGEEDTEIDNAAVVIASDNEPYLFRKSGGAQDITGADRESPTLIGGTVAWNQLVANNHKTQSESTTSTGFSLRTYENLPASIGGHVYVQSMTATLSSNARWRFRYPAVSADFSSSATFLSKVPSSTVFSFGVQLYSTDGNEATFTFDNIMFIDLTLAFGSAIADYLYNLESGTAGAGIAKLKEWGFLEKPYYAYDAGSLQSVNVSEHKTTGFNQFDKSTAIDGKRITNTGAIGNSASYCLSDYIRVDASKTYYIKNGVGSSAFYTSACFDGNKNFIQAKSIGGSAPASGTINFPSGTEYVRLNILLDYKDTACINISKPTGTPKNGDYIPYEAHTYALDSSLTLRGIPKLDASNNLYYDGDTYESDGKVVRKYIEITINGASVSGFGTSSAGIKYVSGSLAKASKDTLNKVMTKYVPSISGTIDGAIRTSSTTLFVYDNSFTSLSAAQTALNANPITLVYELATPTEETAEGFTSPQICDPNGTEQYTDYGVAQGTRDVAIPVGHETDYFNAIGYVITNPSFFASKPLIRAYGSGIFYVNNTSVTIAAHTEPYIDIDSELQECFYEDTNMNSYVTFSGNDYPELQAGVNGILPTPGITKLIVTPRWWIL